jgi:hypothetical protein
MIHTRTIFLLNVSKGVCDTPTTIDTQGLWRYIPLEEWEVEYTDEFGAWWEGLSEAEQVDVRAEVNLLRRFGPTPAGRMWTR